MLSDPTAEGLLAGRPEAVAEIRSWIRGASTPYRSRVGLDLEDLEQEILIGVTIALRGRKFDQRSSFKTYVRSFAVHKCIDRVRSLSRRRWVDIDDLELHASEPSALESLSRREVRQVAQEVIEQMPEECRQLWEMLQQGMRYQEMAVETGVAPGTLRVRVLRCRQKATKLRQEILEARNNSLAATTK